MEGEGEGELEGEGEEALIVLFTCLYIFTKGLDRKQTLSFHVSLCIHSTINAYSFKEDGISLYLKIVFWEIIMNNLKKKMYYIRF